MSVKKCKRCLNSTTIIYTVPLAFMLILLHIAHTFQYPVMFRGEETPDPEKLEKVHEALGWLDGYLAGHNWAVGDNITIADHVLVATVSTFEASGIDVAKYGNVAAWLERCKTTMPGYAEVNQPGAEAFGKMAKAKLGNA